MNNRDWPQSNRHHGYPHDGGPPDANWEDTIPYLPGILEEGTPYTTHLDSSSFPIQTSQQNNGQPRHRGKPTQQPYSHDQGGPIGSIPRAAEALHSPFDPFKTPSNPRQGNMTRSSWLDSNNQDMRRPNPSSSLEDSWGDKRESTDCARKISDLERKISDLERKISDLERKISDLEGKISTGVSELEEKMIRSLRDMAARVENKFRNQMEENNTAVATWLHEVKVGMEIALPSSGKLNGGSRTHTKLDDWNGPNSGNEDEGENQELLSGLQSGDMDFMK